VSVPGISGVVNGDAGDPEAYGFAPGARVRDAETGFTGCVLEPGDEHALVRFPNIGDLWVPYDELLPGDKIIGEY
jgi:hypothetical protein